MRSSITFRNEFIYLSNSSREINTFQKLKKARKKKAAHSSAICLFQVVTGGGPVNYVTNVPIPAFFSSYLCLHGARGSLISIRGFFFFFSCHSASFCGMGTPRIQGLALWGNGILNGAENMQQTALLLRVL